MVLYVLLIIAFSFFYAYTQFNRSGSPTTLEEQRRLYPRLHPAVRHSAEYISNTEKRDRLGALFLFIGHNAYGYQAPSHRDWATSLGGDPSDFSVVALETVNQLEAQMVMRHYRSFLA